MRAANRAPPLRWFLVHALNLHSEFRCWGSRQKGVRNVYDGVVCRVPGWAVHSITGMFRILCRVCFAGRYFFVLHHLEKGKSCVFFGVCMLSKPFAQGLCSYIGMCEVRPDQSCATTINTRVWVGLCEWIIWWLHGKTAHCVQRVSTQGVCVCVRFYGPQSLP